MALRGSASTKRTCIGRLWTESPRDVLDELLFGYAVGDHVRDDLLAQVSVLNHDLLLPVKSAVETLRIPAHVDDFTNGIVDTRQVFFYVTGCILALLFSILGVEAKILNS